MHWHGCWNGLWGFPWLFPFLFIGFGGFALWRAFGRGGSRPCWQTGQAEAPLELAKRRYARGEISREEFEEIKRNIL